MKAHKKAQLIGYPYYLAVHREGRHKGQYPSPEVKYTPTLRKQWDRGGLGSGVKMSEFKSEDIDDLVNQLRQRRINPAFDDVDFFIIRAPNSAREGIAYQRLLALRDRPQEKKEAPTFDMVEPVGRAMPYAGADNWYKRAKRGKARSELYAWWDDGIQRTRWYCTWCGKMKYRSQTEADKCCEEKKDAYDKEHE